MNVKEYAELIFRDIKKAVVPQRTMVRIGEWQPEPNMCHHNVSIWCENNPEYSPVRGWLYFDLPALGYVKFVSHSVVLTPNGELFDITPSNASQDYPFVLSGLSEEEYAALVEGSGISEIVHEMQNA